MSGIDLKSEYIVLDIPEESVEVTVTAKIYRDGEIMTVERKLGLKEIREAVAEADAIYIPPDATFVLTDTGRAMLEKQNREEAYGCGF